MSNHDNSNDAVKDLGRKARVRREQEINKRREIVRLEASDTNPQKKAPKSISISAPKRKRPAVKRKRSSKVKRTDEYPVNRNLDTRFPDVSHLKELIGRAGKKSLSDVVRLHGVPVGATRGDVSRFFSGLDIEQIFVHVLPTLPFE